MMRLPHKKPSRPAHELSRPTVYDAQDYLRRGHRIALMHRPRADGGCSCGRDNCSNIGKHPRFARWTTTVQDPATVRRLLKRFPDSNLAIITGTNGLVVLDIDPRSGGAEELNRLEKKYGKLPIGPLVHTGGGGSHHYFRADQQVRSAIAGPGVEIKAEGNCVVAPPSLHASGRHYSWALGRNLELELPPIPRWLQTLPRIRTSQFPPSTETHTGFSQGERNSGMARLAGLLIGKKIAFRLVLSLLISFDKEFNNPPLGVLEVQTIAESIARKELAKRRAAQ